MSGRTDPGFNVSPLLDQVVLPLKKQVCNLKVVLDSDLLLCKQMATMAKSSVASKLYEWLLINAGSPLNSNLEPRRILHCPFPILRFTTITFCWRCELSVRGKNPEGTLTRSSFYQL